jgi:hypothetical protein
MSIKFFSAGKSEAPRSIIAEPEAQSLPRISTPIGRRERLLTLIRKRQTTGI